MECCLSGSTVEGENVFAVAIRQFSPEQLHLGIYCKSEKGESVIHLINNYNVARSNSIANYDYLEFVQLDDEYDVIHMISLAESLCDKVPCEIAYGPCGGAGFDENGNYFGDIGDGLTCSSFVLALIESQGYSLITKETWPIREEDKKWQLEALTGLKDKVMFPDDQDHIELQMKKWNDGALRFRPDEVGASVTFEDTPNDFETISESAARIRSYLNEKA